MPNFAVVDAPSILGLRPTGVETLPDALKRAGLIERLAAHYAGRVDAPPYRAERDADTLLLNPHAIKEFSLDLSKKIAAVLDQDKFPVVLGGDCSVLIGCLLALRQRGQYGLFFIDGHADFYQPEAEPNGEVASMELAIVTARGPQILADIDGLKPLVRDDHTVAFGYRDVEAQREDSSQDIRTISTIHTFDIEQIYALGCAVAAEQAVTILNSSPLDGYWIHFDVDAVADTLMPAVDYRLPGGLQWREIIDLLHMLMASGRAVGITVTIFNPKLDPGGSLAEKLVDALVSGLS